MTAPREIDRRHYLEELEHRAAGRTWRGSRAIGWVLDELAELDVLKFREPADDPSKDPVGTVRRVDDESKSAVKVRHDAWYIVRDNDEEAHPFQDDEVTDWEKRSPVPGTPAAAAQTSKGRVFKDASGDLWFEVEPDTFTFADDLSDAKRRHHDYETDYARWSLPRLTTYYDGDVTEVVSG